MAPTAIQTGIERKLELLQRVPERQEDYQNHQDLNTAIISIFRFLCEGQEWLDRVPTADGSNLRFSAAFTGTYNWFREWLSLCHRETVFRWELGEPMTDAERDARLERNTYSLANIEPETRRNLDMQPFRRLYNQHASVLAAWGVNVQEPVSRMDQDCELLANLILAEDTFEHGLSGTHVEDVLLEKRFDLAQLQADRRTVRLGTDPLDEIYRIQDCERDGWWIRQLRQHGFRRPWKQLYLVRDDSICQKDTQAIQRVAAYFQPRRRPGATGNGPADFEKNRIERALDVQPIALSALKDEGCAVGCGRHDDDEAGTSADFGAHDIVMLQFCGQHWIHADCAFQAWDVLGQNKFSFPCPLCRQDAGRLSDKLDIDREEGNFNVGFDPEQDQKDAFMTVQFTFDDDLTLLERQHELPRLIRVKALREQQQLLEYADEQDLYYTNLIANWQPNPQNPPHLRSKPVHPEHRKKHEDKFHHLYDFEDDDDPPLIAAAHWHEDAIEMMQSGVRSDELPPNLEGALQQWVENGRAVDIIDYLAALEARNQARADEDPQQEGDDGNGEAQPEPVEDQPEPADQDMPDALDVAGDGGDDVHDGFGGIQNAFARWKKVDAVKGTVGKQAERGSRAGGVPVVKAVRRSPRLERRGDR